MINEIYRICDTSDNIKRDITALFYENGIESLNERGFSSEVAQKLGSAFSGIEGIKVFFASSLKASDEGTEGAGYGLISFTLPRQVQEKIKTEAEIEMMNRLAAAEILTSMGNELFFQHQYMPNQVNGYHYSYTSSRR